MNLSDFDYILPKELIAQYPCEHRDKCRLMMLDRGNGSVCHKTFEDILNCFASGDLLVLNDTRVIPARLFGNRKSGGKVELFLLDKFSSYYEALIRPSGRIAVGEKIVLESGHEVQVLGKGQIGRVVHFSRFIDEILSAAGHMPLPPYIDRADEESDKHNYQTVYALKDGATASPTAGLHFTRDLLQKIQDQGTSIASLTLHTNYGTFAPIKTEDVESHKMHKEHFNLSVNTIDAIRKTKASGGKVFAVGTTTTRVLEHCADEILSTDGNKGAKNLSGNTGIFIYPGYKFKIVDHLITNFHLPKSTLMLLVCAFAGRDFVMDVYKQAIENRYRFFSYGDSMLIL